MPRDDWDRGLQIKQCEPLEESELEALCGYVKEVLVEESNVQPVNSPVTVCGDIHGRGGGGESMHSFNTLFLHSMLTLLKKKKRCSSPLLTLGAPPV